MTTYQIIDALDPRVLDSLTIGGSDIEVQEQRMAVEIVAAGWGAIAEDGLYSPHALTGVVFCELRRLRPGPTCTDEEYLAFREEANDLFSRMVVGAELRIDERKAHRAGGDFYICPAGR